MDSVPYTCMEVVALGGFNSTEDKNPLWFASASNEALHRTCVPRSPARPLVAFSCTSCHADPAAASYSEWASTVRPCRSSRSRRKTAQPGTAPCVVTTVYGLSGGECVEEEGGRPASGERTYAKVTRPRDLPAEPSQAKPSPGPLPQSLHKSVGSLFLRYVSPTARYRPMAREEGKKQQPPPPDNRCCYSCPIIDGCLAALSRR